MRARLDARTTQGFGRRATEWELKGVPVRIEVGPRDLDAGQVTLARRDSGEKSPLPVGEVAERVPMLLETMHAELIEAARRRLEERTVDVTTVDEALAAAQTGFARIPWRLLGDDGEATLNRSAVTVRCLQTVSGEVPGAQDSDDDLVAIVARSY